MPMRQIHAAAALLAAAGALALPGAASAAPRAEAKLTACHADAAAAGRSLSATAVMRSRPGSARLDVRFDLLARGAGGAWRRIAGPGLGSWIKSDAGVTAFRAVKTIQGLAAPGIYRVAVRFRWIGPRGRVQAIASRLTGPCVQPDQRPDLKVVGGSVAPGNAKGTLAYTAVIRNLAPAASPAFDVLLRVDGVAQPAVTVPGFAALERRRVTISAAACTRGTGSVEVVLDPDNRVAERNEANNVLTVPCRRA
jgi:CARDB